MLEEVKGTHAVEQLPMFGDSTKLSSSPLLKWPGGKEGELGHIHGAMPSKVDRIFEPFVGGGAVFLSRLDVPALINDRSFDLVNFYRCLTETDQDIFRHLEGLDAAWCEIEAVSASERAAIVESCRVDARFHELADRLVECFPELWSRCGASISSKPGIYETLSSEIRAGVAAKLRRMNKLEAQHGRLTDDDVVGNVEGAMKAAMYMTVRAVYNTLTAAQEREPSAHRAAMFYFLREYCYASMFRFNRSGEFNVPYGGMSYNRKRMARKIEAMRAPVLHRALSQTKIFNCDFELFLEQAEPRTTDFVFFDPPYDTDFSTYDQSAFTSADQKRLRNVVGRISARCSLMLVVKATPLMKEFYEDGQFRVRYFDKTYMWTIKERNDRQAQHMLITNY